MDKSIDVIRGSRIFLLNLIEGISVDKLNKIPEGFHNNLVWNLGHVIATQQKVCYVNPGLKPLVDESFITGYQTGTKPEGFVDESTIAKMKEDLLSNMDQMEKDLPNNIFGNFHPFEIKSYPGLKIENIEDALRFLTFHEGLHVGYSMALKRLVS